jgi:phage shock protein C
MNTKRLYRSTNDRMFAGVCGGIAEYFSLDPTVVRLVFAVLILVGVGSPVLAYIVLWFIMPEAPTTFQPPSVNHSPTSPSVS